MDKPQDQYLNSDALLLLACFMVRETLRTLKAKDLLTDSDVDAAVDQAIVAMQRSTLGITQEEMDLLVNVVLGRSFTSNRSRLS